MIPLFFINIFYTNYIIYKYRINLANVEAKAK